MSALLLILAALAGAGAVYAWACQALHGHRCPRCGDLAGHIGFTCGHGDAIVCPDCEGNSRTRLTVSLDRDQVPMTAFTDRVQPTDAGAEVVLRYVAGDVPAPGQLVSLHHGPRPTGAAYDCELCGDQRVVPCEECGGTGHVLGTTDDMCPAVECEFGDVPCPDCGGAS